MNIGIVVHYIDSPWIQSHKRWLSSYIFPMQAFGVDTLILVGWQEISHGYDINYKQHDTIESVIEKYPKHKIVLSTGYAKKSLQDYKHPKDKVLYVFGNDYADVPDIKGDRVKIETCNNSNILWSHNCASIVLYDRYIKNDNN